MADINIALSGSGTVGDIGDWSVDESVSPINIASSQGGTGRVSIDAKGNSTTKFIVDNDATVTHTTLGSISGVVDDVSITGAGVSLGVASILNLLNTEVTAEPSGNVALSEIFANYIALAASGLVVTYSATTDPLRIYGAWKGDLWTKLKELAAANNVEISVRSGAIVISDVGITELNIDDNESITLNLSTESSGLYVDIINQNTALAEATGGVKYNYSQNPSLGTNATGWTGFTANLTATQGRDTTAWAFGGASYSSLITAISGSPIGAIAHGITHTIDISSLPDNEAFSVSVYSTIRNLADGNKTCATAYINWGDGTGFAQYQLRNRGINASWIRSDFGSHIKTPGSTTVSVQVQQQAAFGATIKVGDTLYADAVMLTNGSQTTYFDGTFAGASWVGAADNSTSLRAITGSNEFYNAKKEDQIFSVDVNQRTRTTLTTTNFPDALVQPTQSLTPVASVGTYYVTSGNNLAVSPTLWNLNGGKVQVAIGELPGTIELILTGPKQDIPGMTSPYYLGYWNGDERVPSFSIAGSGVLSSPVPVRIETGADPEKTTTEVSSSVNSPFITSQAMAFDRGVWATVEAAGPVMTLTVQMGAHQLEGFGLTPGALIRYNDCIFRVSSTSIQGIHVTVVAKWYVKTSELESLWYTLTSTNYALNPSFEVLPTGATNFGTGVNSRSTTQKRVGTYAMAVQRGAGVGDDYVELAVTGLTGGLTYNVSYYVYITAANTTYLSRGMLNVCIGGTPNVSQAPYDTGLLNQWQLVSVDHTVNPGGNGIYIRSYAMTGIPLWVDTVQVTEGAGVQPYFSGSTAAGGGFLYNWKGAANTSQSTKGAGVSAGTFDTFWSAYEAQDVQIAPLRD